MSVQALQDLVIAGLSLSGISARLTEGRTDSLTVATISAFQDVKKSTAHFCDVLGVRCPGILVLVSGDCSGEKEELGRRVFL